MENFKDPPGTVRFVIGSNRLYLLVTKEIICISNYFRNLLQPRRKAIEGNCPICQEALKEGIEEDITELTYCASSCGNNFHKVCLDEWERSKANRAPLQCPMCRQHWDKEGTYTITAITPRAFIVYYNWLKLGYIPLRPPWNRHLFTSPTLLDFPDFPELVECYQLGVFISDPKFSKAALQNILRECIDTGTIPNFWAVHTAYAITSVSSPLRKLIVEIYTQLNDMESRWVFINWDEYPRMFQSDLTQALLQKHCKPRVGGLASMLQKMLEDDQYTGSGGEEGLPSEDDEGTDGFVQNGS